MTFWRDVRCVCHKLHLRISSTSNARLEVKCPRCAKLTSFTFAPSTGA